MSKRCSMVDFPSREAEGDFFFNITLFHTRKKYLTLASRKTSSPFFVGFFIYCLRNAGAHNFSFCY